MFSSRIPICYLRAAMLVWCVSATAPLRAQAQAATTQLDEQLQVLARSPNNMAARKEAWRAAMRLGLYDQAASLGAELDPAERAQMEGDQIALAIRYGRVDAATLNGAARYGRLNAALAATDELSQNFLAGQPLDTEQRRRLFDRVSALVARQRPADAVTLFESLQARGNDGPTWLKTEVADAYLSVRRPVHAELLYRQSLASTPDSFNAKLGLFYALSDQGKADEAMTQIDAVAIGLPQRRRRDGGANEERLSAEIVSDQARLYADRIVEAEQRLEQHAYEVPFNGEVRQALAGLALARGWNRAGETELRRAIAQDPSSAGLHAERAEVLLGLQRWREADAELQLARELDDSNPRVRQAAKNFELQNRPEWNTEVGYGNGENSSPLGSIDWHFDSWLYTPPIYSQHKHSNWRAFVHHNSTNADFDAAMTRWQRTGVGVQWRAGNWQASGEVNEGYDFDPGVLTSVSWQPDDYWRISAAAELLSNDVPMQAVRAGITTNRYSLGVDWAAHEARSIGMAVGQNDFTDGNLRNSFAVSWFERWHSSSAWQVETRLGGDMSRNSLGYTAVYFNPPTDHSVWGSVAVENLFWRDYASSLRQRVVVSLGSYWQEGFGADNVQVIEYEHRWELGPSASLRYGISHSQRPYDGDRETRTSGAANFLWRF